MSTIISALTYASMFIALVIPITGIAYAISAFLDVVMSEDK